MPLDAHTQDLLDRMRESGPPPLETLSLREARELAAARFQDGAGPTAPAFTVVNRTVPGPGGPIPVRLYYPDKPGPHPIVIYFHGGGWVLCGLDTHDNTCRRMVDPVGCMVMNVDYRLAPEHPFPAAVEDAFAAVQWVAEHGADIGADPSRIAVAGDSAGGNLAAVCCLLAREAGGPAISFQLLVVPVTEFLPDNASYRDNADGYYLTRSFMQWFFEMYRPDPQDWRAFPSLAASLEGLPPALVLTAEFDPLRDEGEGYARRLEQAGVPATIRRFEGTIHQFFVMPEFLPQGYDAMTLAVEHLRRAFEKKTVAAR